MVARDPCFEDERERYRDLYVSCASIPAFVSLVKMDDLGPMACLDFEREMAKQQLVMSQAIEQQKLGIMCPHFYPIDMSICQAKQFMPETKLESLPELEPVYKEKVNVKWYELLILAALAWAPFMLGLLLKLLNS